MSYGKLVIIANRGQSMIDRGRYVALVGSTIIDNANRIMEIQTTVPS